MPVPLSRRKPVKPSKLGPKAHGIGPGRGPGAPAFQPTNQQRAMVKALAIAGFRQRDIAKAIRNPATDQAIGVNTLLTYFRDELDLAFFETAALTVQNFMRKCTGAPAQYDPKTGKLIRKEVESDTRAQTFFLNTRLKAEGWNARIEHTGKDGAPLPGSIGVMSDEQLDQFIERLESRTNPGASEGGESPAPKKTRKPRKSHGRDKGAV